MKIKVADKLCIGDGDACSQENDASIAIVHACKEPCHRTAVGYVARSLANTHPHYLALERDNHLFLNLIDPETPMFMMGSFVAFLSFVDRHIGEREVLIHCNQGESRSRSLAMLYMAKRLGLLPNDSYDSAAAAFRVACPFNPSRGITSWLQKHWTEIT